jgi:DNA-binding NarL/FixJ family response regulator
LFEALKTVMSGGIFVPELASGGVGSAAAGGHSATEAPLARPSLSGYGLTPRQTEVLGLLLQGKPNKIIARELDVSVDTVKDHVAAVLRALKVTTRTQAVLVVGRMGNVFPGPWRQPD